MFRVILLGILGYLLYRLIRPALSAKPANPHVKGESQDESVIQKKKNVEDAEFEDLDD